MCNSISLSEKALEMLQNEDVMIMFLDLNLPGMRGGWILADGYGKGTALP